MKFEYLIPWDQMSNGTEKLVKRPLLEIEIFGPNGSHKELALVDSGADRSVFSMQIAEYLGVDLERARKQRIRGVTGIQEAFIADIEIQVKHLANKVTIPVAFLDSQFVSVLLGQEGFFDMHRIKFEKDHDTFEVIPVRQ